MHSAWAWRDEGIASTRRPVGAPLPTLQSLAIPARSCRRYRTRGQFRRSRCWPWRAGLRRLSAGRSPLASRTAFSISRCDVTPTFLRNLRRLVLSASSFIVASGRMANSEWRMVKGPFPIRHSPFAIRYPLRVIKSPRFQPRNSGSETGSGGRRSSAGFLVGRDQTMIDMTRRRVGEPPQQGAEVAQARIGRTDGAGAAAPGCSLLSEAPGRARA